jgi:hypothetical protein
MEPSLEKYWRLVEEYRRLGRRRRPKNPDTANELYNEEIRLEKRGRALAKILGQNWDEDVKE